MKHWGPIANRQQLIDIHKPFSIFDHEAISWTFAHGVVGRGLR
jgi:hypothetical protein